MPSRKARRRKRVPIERDFTSTLIKLARTERLEAYLLMPGDRAGNRGDRKIHGGPPTALIPAAHDDRVSVSLPRIVTEPVEQLVLGFQSPWEETLDCPLRVPEVELVGQMQGMAYARPKWLICLNGAQYIQATTVLYHVLSHADGKTHIAEIARRVTVETHTVVSPEEVRWLVVNRLAPSGLLVLSSDESPNGHETALSDASPGSNRLGRVPPPQAPVLGIRHRLPLLPYRVTAPLTAVLQHLYWPPVMAVVVLLAAAVNVWLYRGTDLLRSIETLFLQPETILILFGMDIVTRIWHELGHASALRRAGSRYGSIGFALYAIFPVFYTDVTHSYRLNRGQRIRVDLGGMYFDLITMIVMFVAYRITGYGLLLLLLVLMGFGILEQFTPFMRFDGYYLIADVIGVPEPLSMLGPFLRDHLPWRRDRGKRFPTLRPLARLILVIYFVVVLAFLLRPGLVMAIAGGQILALLPQTGILRWSQFLQAWHTHSIVLQIAATLQLALWALIPLGLALFVFGLVRLFVRALLVLLKPAVSRVRVRWQIATGSAAGAAELGKVPARKRYWATVVSLALLLGLGAAAAAGVVSSQLARYEATVTVSARSGEATGPAASSGQDPAPQALARQIMSRDQVQQVLRDLQSRDDPADILQGIAVHPRGGDHVLEVKVTHRDPSRAAEIANRLVRASVAQLEAEQRQQVNLSLRTFQTAISDVANQITNETRGISSLEALPPSQVTASDRTQLRDLRQKRAIDADAYAALLKNYEEIRANQLARVWTMSVVSPARIPDSPVSPDKRLIMLVAGALGLAMAAGLAPVISNWVHPFRRRNALAVA